MKRRAFLAAAFLAPALTGCPNTKKGGTQPTSGGKAAKPKRAIKVGLVTDVGGVNDKSFNASAWAGLQRAEKELGAKIKFVESRQLADYVPNLSQFAKGGYDVVFAVGTMMKEAVQEVADRHREVKFVLIDGDDPRLPNVAVYKFREEEGSFLAGALAGLMTRSNVIGFVGGQEMPLIEKFQLGYTAGAQTTNPNCNVLIGYAGRFDDPARGREVALSQLGSRADVIFHAAGGTGIGVIKAVAEKGAGVWAIGVDQDQDSEAPGRVLTSMVKRVDRAVFDACQRVASGKFERGETIWGVKEDGIGLSEMKHTKDKVPAEALAKIEELKKQILDGKLQPPATRRDYEDFVASKEKPGQ